VYPSGNISIVSDTYDLWNVVDNVLPQLKDLIMAREGKVVIRPDSGDPVKIICGDAASDRSTVQKGIVERLFELFGGTTNSKGFKELDPHIGVVYGDSITVDRADKICQGLLDKGFASTNTILGIGSYTYQYVTRDTFGFALKGTAEIVNGEFKAMQKGMVAVVFENDDFRLIDDLTPQTVADLGERNLLETCYLNGEFIRTTRFEEIRNRLRTETIRVYGK